MQKLIAKTYHLRRTGSGTESAADLARAAMQVVSPRRLRRTSACRTGTKAQQALLLTWVPSGQTVAGAAWAKAARATKATSEAKAIAKGEEKTGRSRSKRYPRKKREKKSDVDVLELDQ